MVRGRMVRLLALAALAGACVAVPTAAAGPAGDRTLPASTTFYVPAPDQGAIDQIAQLQSSGDSQDAALIAAMVARGHAVWFTSGNPGQVENAVRSTVDDAAAKGRVPVLVAYDVPFRDCAQYSAGGAKNTSEYLAWIEGLSAGIGQSKAVVILEPDGLGLIPNAGCTLSAESLAAAGLTAEQAEQQRYAQISGAIDILEKRPSTLVYLDATHPAWMAVGDIAQRLVTAGVQRAQGFFVNASNYQYTANDTFYGTWISDCIAYATQLSPGNYGGCPNQYWDGGPATNWDGDALDPTQVWSDQPYSGNHADLRWNTTGIDSRWASMLGSVAPTTHFVIDTSRNGRGPWSTTTPYPDKQDWCNPPGRGLGVAPTADTGNPLVDAYLWIKVPGESDGSCNRGIAGSTTDPEWGGIVDPPAGSWFPQQALQLAQLGE